MNIDDLTAIDVHVHIEHTGEDTDVERAAGQYFGASGVTRDRQALADYYRSRKIGCVVFTVAETLSKRPQVSNDEVADFAAANADIAMAFASLNPHDGQRAVDEARRLV